MSLASTLRKIAGPVLSIAGAVVFVYNPYAGTALMAAGAGLQAREAKRAAADLRRRARAQAAARSVRGTIVGTTESHNLVFGEVRVGGLIMGYNTTSDTTKDLVVIVAHSLSHAGGCEGLNGIWIDETFVPLASINGDLYTNASALKSSYADVTLAKYVAGSSTAMVRLRHYKGTSGQTYDLFAEAQGVDTDTSSDRKGIDYTVFIFTKPTAVGEDADFRAAFPRLPVPGAQLKGIKIYDPRLDSTQTDIPGAGTHRYDDPTTWEYSANAALCLGTYLIMAKTDGGVGRDPTDIDWVTLAATADICDASETIPGGSEPRYEFNGVISTADDYRTNIQKFIAAMHGAYVVSEGTIKIYAAADVATSATIDEDWLNGELAVSPKSASESIYNSVRVLHPDADKKYELDEAPAYVNASYITEDDGEQHWDELTLDGVTSTYQAQRIGTIHGKLSRAQQVLKVPCNLRALNVKAWDTVTLQFSELGINGKYRIIQWEWTGNGALLTCRPEDAAYYSGVSYSTPAGFSGADSSDDLPTTPSGVTATAVGDGIDLTWTGPDVGEIKEIEVWRSTTMGSGHAKIRSVVGYEYHDPLGVDDDYYYLLRSVDRRGFVSDFSSEVSETFVAADLSAINNFNNRNDRDGSAITAPVVAADGTAVDHVNNTDSSATISFEWTWGGIESDIDGFILKWRESSSSASYVMGTTPAQEQAVVLPAQKRAVFLNGVPRNRYYTFSVQAFRIVDPDIDATGVIYSTEVQPSLGSEDPYRPSSSVPFAGDVTGTVSGSVSSTATISGTTASTVVANSADGATAFNGTTEYRTDAAPSTTPTAGTVTQSATADGNVAVTFNYSYTQGARKADALIIYVHEGTGSPVATDPAWITNVPISGSFSSSMTFVLKPSTNYRFGVAAVRRTESGYQSTGIANTGIQAIAAGNYTGTVAGTTASTVVSHASDGWNMTQAGSGIRTGDQRNLTMLMAQARGGATVSGTGIVTSLYQMVPGTTRIDIAAHTRQFGFGTVSYNSGSITGNTPGATYYVYATDPTFAGGAVTYTATTSKTAATANDGRVFIDSIVAATSGTGSTSGNDDRSEP